MGAYRQIISVRRFEDDSRFFFETRYDPFVSGPFRLAIAQGDSMNAALGWDGVERKGEMGRERQNIGKSVTRGLKHE